jgi:hypothetical protein
VTADEPDDQPFPCPRCGRQVTERFWGPCADCRAQLVATVRGQAHHVEVGRFEPAMHVVPNQVATKE